MTAPALDIRAYDPRDPDPWLALGLDHSLPIDQTAKAALLAGNRSASRQWLYPLVHGAAWAALMAVNLGRRISPKVPNWNAGLHRLIHFGLKRFASPEANLLILRHFHIGTELLAFIRANSGVAGIVTTPLRPKTVADLEANMFLQHDLNVFNFVIQLNAGLAAQGRELEPAPAPDFSMITDGPFDIADQPAGRLNRIDVQTAIEAYVPLYALCLPRADFVRAVGSLQLDEVVAIYIARILSSDYHLNFIKNGHPLVPLPTAQAGFRLMLHGLDCEALHGWLRRLKRDAEQSQAATASQHSAPAAGRRKMEF